MRAGAWMWVVVLGGCLEKNPLYVDPTETSGGSTQANTEATTPFPMGETTDGSDTQSSALTDALPTTSTTTTTLETDGPVQETTGATEPMDSSTSSTTSSTSESSTTTGAVGECGDTILDEGEECDDGNEANDDECTTKCKLASCGDQFLQPPEECDDLQLMAEGLCQPECKWTRKHVFVTSKAFTGADLGGLVGADLQCNKAAKGKLPGTYQAWLSDNKWSPALRMAKYELPYVRSDGEMIAFGWTMLMSDMHKVPIDRDEDKNPPFQTNSLCGSDGVHTNTKETGEFVKPDNDCAGWTGDQGFTTWGSTSSPGQWSNVCPSPCSIPAPIFCVQQ